MTMLLPRTTCAGMVQWCRDAVAAHHLARGGVGRLLPRTTWPGGGVGVGVGAGRLLPRTTCAVMVSWCSHGEGMVKGWCNGVV